MRKPAEVLELALTMLDDHDDSYYMCLHLDWMYMKEHITCEECFDTKAAVRNSIEFRVTLRGYLVYKGILPFTIVTMQPEYRPYMVEFYTNLIATLKQE